MKIGIIIPVVQTNMALKLISQLSTGTVKPDKLIIIDVSQYGLIDDVNIFDNLDFDIVRIAPNPKLPYYVPALGTNEAWTLGYNILKQYIPHYGIVGFLNDDIEVNRYFIQSTLLAYSAYKSKCHLLYPQTIACPKKVQTAKLSYTKLKPTKSRYGYAWFLPRTIFDEIPPFPPECKIWYGDNWVMIHLHRLAYNMHINVGNWIFHHGGTTSRKLKLDMAEHNLNLSKRRREEHKAYLRAARKWRGQNEK